MEKAYPGSFIFVGLLFLWTAYSNVGYEDTSIGTVIFFGFGGVALILEGWRRLRGSDGKGQDKN